MARILEGKKCPYCGGEVVRKQVANTDEWYDVCCECDRILVIEGDHV